ncbi:MAG TPA: hypothetical protein VJN18_11045 [Polyangiaceae bacterium]|nr:hypothetical protein [Polyangiaceae bacterium]
MNDIAFCADIFRFPKCKPYSERALACLLWALIYADESYLQGTNLTIPPLYSSGIYWQEEHPQGRTACPEGDGQEQFLGIRQIRNQGFADCEDIASWRCAELRLGRVPPTRGLPPFAGHPKPTVFPPPYPLSPAGPDVWPAIFQRPTAPGVITIHVIVFWPDGYFEDPSRVLGMGGARKYG